MKFLACLFLLQFLMLTIVSREIVPNWCSSCDDPHLTTFDYTNYEFHELGQHFILYTNLKDIQVTAGFMPCMFDSTLSCNCAIYVRYQDTILFMDICGVATNPDDGLEFYYTIKGDGHIYSALCNTKLMSPANETNNYWWNKPGNARNINSRILCARMEDTDTYVIRTNDRNPNNNVFIRVITHTLGISCIYVRPGINNYNKTGGLCGFWNDNPDDDLYILNKRDRVTIIEDSSDQSNLIRLGLFWRLTSNPPRSQSYRKFDRDLYCPCDQDYDYGNEDTWENEIPSWMNNAIGGASCKKLVSKCALQTTTNKDIEIRSTVRKKEIDRKTAIETCTKNIIDEDIREARNLKMVNLDPIMDMCVKDYMESGDIYWSYTHNNLARNDAIRNIEQTKSQIINESYLKSSPNSNVRLEALQNQTLMDGLKRPLAERIENFSDVLHEDDISKQKKDP